MADPYIGCEGAQTVGALGPDIGAQRRCPSKARTNYRKQLEGKSWSKKRTAKWGAGKKQVPLEQRTKALMKVKQGQSTGQHWVG